MQELQLGRGRGPGQAAGVIVHGEGGAFPFICRVEVGTGNPDKKSFSGKLPSGPVVKTPPSNAGGVCVQSLLGELRSFMPQSTVKN